MIRSPGWWRKWPAPPPRGCNAIFIKRRGGGKGICKAIKTKGYNWDFWVQRWKTGWEARDVENRRKPEIGWESIGIGEGNWPGIVGRSRFMLRLWKMGKLVGVQKCHWPNTGRKNLGEEFAISLTEDTGFSSQKRRHDPALHKTDLTRRTP